MNKKYIAFIITDQPDAVEITATKEGICVPWSIYVEDDKVKYDLLQKMIENGIRVFNEKAKLNTDDSGEKE